MESISIKQLAILNDIEKIESQNNTLNLDYDHLLIRLEASLRYNDKTSVYLDSLKRFSQIPGFTISDQYKSFYHLLCTYNECQTRTELTSSYLDEFIEIVDKIIHQQTNKEQWKRTQPQP